MKYDCYVVEINRNNGIHVKGNEDNLSVYRSMHCNELRCKKLCGEQKEYLNYFRINNIFGGNEQGKTASQTLSLYQCADDDRKDPGSAEAKDPLAESQEAPFLILIQIRLYRKTFSYIKNKETEPDVEGFLRTMERSIKRKVERVFTSAELENLVFKTFRSSTTGDFCLAIRTACEDLIDKTADRLQACTIFASVYMTVWERRNAQGENVYIGDPQKSKFINKGSLALGESAAAKYKRNQQLFERIMELEKHREEFAQENRSFQDLFQATKELYWNYAAAAWEKDTEINWQIWQRDMDTLCNCIKDYMKAYKNPESYKRSDLPEETIKHEFRTKFLQSWRESILAIDRYTRLVHTVNDQDSRTAVFEAQTQIDAEKVMVAYREAMRVYYRGYDKVCAGIYNATTQIEPIVYPLLVKEKITVTMLFTNMSVDPIPGWRFSVCTVPSFENFGRLYDFLPLLMHETAHSIRIMKRAERNAFLIRYTLKYVFLAVIRQLLQEPQDANRYEDMGAATENLLQAFLNAAESEIRTFAWVKRKIRLQKDASFEQTADALASYLQELFPQEINVTKDFKKARDRLLAFFLTEFRQNGMLENPSFAERSKLLADLQALKSGDSAVENAEALMETALTAKNEKVKALLSNRKKANAVLLTIKEFSLPAKAFDHKISTMRKTLEKPKDLKAGSVLNEYIFSVTKLYRIYKLYTTADNEYPDSDEKKKKFLKTVFKEYSEIKRCEKPNTLQDPETMYFLNYMGLLKNEFKVFEKQCAKAFAKLPFNMILEHKNLRTRIYRETCADVMMALSLNLTAFGYCRLIFRVIGDTAQTNSFGRYDSTDFFRFRTVTALLLLNEKNNRQVTQKAYGRDEYKFSGETLLQKGKQYCEHYLKYIREIILGKEGQKYRENLIHFLGDINEQIEVLLREYDIVEYKQSLLYVLLHEEPDNLLEEVQERWKKYEELVAICRKYRQHFWRLECFCTGLHNILPEGDVIVEKDLLDHMLELQKNVANPSSSYACIWENNLWSCMLKAKVKVSKYYNNPQSVNTVSDEEKLEDTIEFIQNYYYHNRVEMAGEEELINGESTKEIIS